ncbi:MAG: ComEC/Rec2 family competence protein, partial [Patescibacteria group bacterium]
MIREKIKEKLEKIYQSKSKTFFAAMGAFILGIAGHSFFGVKIFSVAFIVFLVFLVGFGALIIFWDKKILRFWGLAALFFLFGFWRFDAGIPPTLSVGFGTLSVPPSAEMHVSFYNGREAIVTGVVVSIPEVAVNKTRFTLGAREIDIVSSPLQGEVGRGNAGTGTPTSSRSPSGRGRQLISGNILVTLLGEENLKYGDAVRLQCKLMAPKSDGDFNYAGYLSRFGIYSTCSFVSGLEVVGKNQGNPILSSIYKLRQAANGKINALLLPPASSFLAGLITGERANMPESLRSDFLRRSCDFNKNQGMP